MTSGVMIRRKDVKLFDWIVVTDCTNSKEVVLKIVRMIPEWRR